MTRLSNNPYQQSNKPHEQTVMPICVDAIFMINKLRGFKWWQRVLLHDYGGVSLPNHPAETYYPIVKMLRSDFFLNFLSLFNSNYVSSWKSIKKSVKLAIFEIKLEYGCIFQYNLWQIIIFLLSSNVPLWTKLFKF